LPAGFIKSSVDESVFLTEKRQKKPRTRVRGSFAFSAEKSYFLAFFLAVFFFAVFFFAAFFLAILFFLHLVIIA
jgi:hypothetical protein